MIIHQDSFARDYQDEGYTLFGKAMKFASICGKEFVSSARRGKPSERRRPHSYNSAFLPERLFGVTSSLSLAAIFFFTVRLHVLFCGVRLLVTESADLVALLHDE